MVTTMFVELTVRSGDLGILEPGALPVGTNVEFERTVSIYELAAPTLRVDGDVQALLASLRRNPAIEDVSTIGMAETDHLVKFSWRNSLPPIFERIRELEGTVLSAVATGDRWTLGIRFPSQKAASRLNSTDDDIDVSFDVRRIRTDDVTVPSFDHELTVPQREALLLAMEKGYFEVPRRTTLVDLANEFGISDSAMSQRLRRGIATLLESSSDHERKKVLPELRTR